MENLKPVVGRDRQLEELKLLLAVERGMPVHSVMVYGNSGTGKTFCVKHALKGVRHIWLNCVEILQARCLFSSIINNLNRPSTLASLEDIAQLVSCDTPSEFLCLFAQYVSVDEKLYIVMDNAHRLRDLDLITFFLRLQELSERQVCCIYISTVTFTHLMSSTEFFFPHEVYFPNYNLEELRRILLQSKPPGYSDQFYENYISLVIPVFKHVTNSAKELMHIVTTNFEHYVAPCELDPEMRFNSLKLWKNIEPYLKTAMDTVYLRDADTGAERTESTKATKQIIELPFYSKFLLIAAYLASYNPASTDKKFFVKKSNRERRKNNTIRRERPNYHLLGPRPFPLNRLLAIFYAIVDTSVEPSAALLSQVSSLVHQKLLTQATASDPLGAPRYKCCVDFDYVTSIAKTVKFPVVEYLQDFNI